ncbi:MAG TPA: CAP domain-containing protein [Ureibacillus sp.]|nr:CAP domain-containing protein [Ureibacillus sp.]
MKKLLATTLAAATLFGVSFTSADAASLNKEVKIENNPQIMQMVKGENYQAIAYKLIDQITVQNGHIDLSKLESLVNKSLNATDANKVIQQLKVVQKSNTTNQSVAKAPTAPAKQTTTKAPAAPAKQTTTKAPTAPTKQTATPATKAPTTNTNNQQVQTPVKQAPTATTNQSVSDFEKQVVDLTNAERQKAGLKPLAIYNPLMDVAQAKSDDMAKNKYFDHNSPTYGSPFDQMKAAGISYKAAGENIAQGQTTPAQVVQAWMDSPGHRANILNANFTHIGVGYVANGNYWTQQFIQL